VIEYSLSGGEKTASKYQKRRKKFQFGDNLGSMDTMESTETPACLNVLALT
jgi:hypothetical protein